MKAQPQPDTPSPQTGNDPASRPIRPYPDLGAFDLTRRIPLRLAFGLVTGVGFVAVVWLMGFLGFARGFAPLMRVDQLQVGPGGGLGTGTMMLIAVPTLIVRAGSESPGLLMVAFALLAIPAAGLSATRGRGAEAASLTVVFSYAGAVTAGLHASAAIWWTASAMRLDRIRELPFDPRADTTWLVDLQTAAGLDVLLVVATALWAILVLRLSIPLWLKVMAASCTLFTLVVVAVAMAISNAAAAEVQAPRALVFLSDDSLAPQLQLGFTRAQVVTLRREGTITVVELHDPATTMTVIGRQSIVGMLEESD